ncbi:hypothetical protein [Fontibacillus phaseoli]|uniref:hypothetical protein n=1 Tax=Fontibacillus phaseoli TaxID=1416533 RepID=UPI0015F09581|nr:hypothetical protein [Fontibacillus phaseoli]
MFKRGPLTGTHTVTFTDVPTTYWAYQEIEEAARDHKYNIGDQGGEVVVKE